MAESSSNPYRLPRTVVPKWYELRMEPDLDEFSFAGSVGVDIEVLVPVAEIVLNAADLEITGGNLDGVALGGIDYDTEHERVVLRLAEPASPGAARLNLRFAGTLNDQLRGFYRSTFTDTDGNQRVIATTQFESTNARRAFPCWDEPDLKAVFEVTLVVPDGLMAISSGAEIASQPTGDDRREVSFAPTMAMSTYLLAFVVGPLEATDPVDVNGTPLRVVHPTGKGHLTEFALDAGSFTLDFFERYFAIDYPGDKLDLVAIPDFAFGAMENMGCVTFREVLLLVDPNTSTQQERQTAADVIAHELAHMWFGNLVTMRWWNGIWLKEAFATFCELLAVDAYRPDWKRWLSFGLSRAAAFDVDALAATRTIEYPVVSPADAEGMYDLLTYEKGAAVVRMLEQYLGADAFRDGVRQYLRRHSYANTETHDLWDALAEATGEPVRPVMDSWIFQGGHPVVTVTPDEHGAITDTPKGHADREQVAASDHGAITLSQRRFRYDGQPDETRWQVPVVATVGSTRAAHTRKLQDHDATRGTAQTMSPPAAPARKLQDHDATRGTAQTMSPPAEHTEKLVLEDQARIEIGSGWVMVNPDADGFYRVAYDDALLNRLLDSGPELAPLQRYVLADDQWALTVAGHLDVTGYLGFAERIAATEDDLAVWRKLASTLTTLDHLVPASGRTGLQVRVRDMVEPAWSRLGWAPVGTEDDRTRELRGVLVRIMALEGNDTGVTERCRKLMAAENIDPALAAIPEQAPSPRLPLMAAENIDPALAAAAVAVVAATGDRTDYEELRKRFRNAPTPQLELRYLTALTAFGDPVLMDRTLAATLDGTVRSQDAGFVIRGCLENRELGPQAWAFTTEHWDEINRRLPSAIIPRMLGGICALSTPGMAQSVRSFLDDHPVPQGSMIVAQHLERLHINVGLRNRVEQELG
ncbi:M1 family metallopeptidase [Candidatus Poriferisocius sp.]|uniref:M1 family metallopeptidase n=1 Tax=Candidatus Poriferisocius sp. TaxID=3101276 RepID=UPI003B02A6F4